MRGGLITAGGRRGLPLLPVHIHLVGVMSGSCWASRRIYEIQVEHNYLASSQAAADNSEGGSFSSINPLLWYSLFADLYRASSF